MFTHRERPVGNINAKGTVNLTQNFSYFGRCEPAPKQRINELELPACPKYTVKSVKLTIPNTSSTHPFAPLILLSSQRLWFRYPQKTRPGERVSEGVLANRLKHGRIEIIVVIQPKRHPFLFWIID